MNKETLSGKWHEIKGTLKEKWGKLTDSDIAQINGKREILLGKLESRYGFAKDKAEKELQDFEKSCGCSSSGSSMGAHQADKGAHQEKRGQQNASHEKPQARGTQDRTHEKTQDRNQDRTNRDTDRNDNSGRNDRDNAKRK